MRINQLQTLCWAGNLLVFAGMAFVGYLFVGAVKNQKNRAEVEWPGGADAGNPLDQTWPPGEASFTHIHLTHVNGLVPEPPKPPVEVKVERDPWKIFQPKVGFKAIWEFQGTPSASTITLSYNKADAVFSPGQFVEEDWQVIGYQLRPAVDSAPAAHVVTFYNVKKKSYHDLVTPITVPKVVAPGGLVSFVPKFSDPVSEGAVSEQDLKQQAYQQQGSDVYRIPDHEMWWWRYYGKKAMAQAGAQFQAGNDTLKQGIVFGRDLHSHATLKGQRGVLTGDLVTAVNGTPIDSVEALVAYFAGEVDGVRSFELTVMKDGAERKVKYLIERGSSETETTSKG